MDNRTLPATAIGGTNNQSRRTGDVLTNYLVREGAGPQGLPDEVKLQAFLFGVAVGLNDNAVQPQVFLPEKLWARSRRRVSVQFV